MLEKILMTCMSPNKQFLPLHFSVNNPLRDLWKLDLATRCWSEPEQHGSRPCARTITHGMERLPCIWHMS